MPKFYFTYGTDHEFSGGWTEVIAENDRIATNAFVAYHPLKNGFLPCCTYYSEEEFMRTNMGKTGNNLGHGCWETITITRTTKGEN